MVKHVWDSYFWENTFKPLECKRKDSETCPRGASGTCRAQCGANGTPKHCLGANKPMERAIGGSFFSTLFFW